MVGVGLRRSVSNANPPQTRSARTGRSALFVALGIALSRVAGLIRQSLIARYFGLSAVADAWSTAFRIPNFLQNLFGEGALSASFIPVYAALVARGERGEADRVAGAVASILALVVSVIVLLGVLLTPWLIPAIAPGFTGSKRALTIDLVRILFPGAGLLVLSAWCLGVLNSHHRFLLSYTAPVAWNVAMIATLFVYGYAPQPRLALFLAWGSVAGSALQLAVQMPVVLRVAPDLRFALDVASDQVRIVVRNFVPTFIGRGVVQLSVYIDTWLASWLPTGAVAGLSNAGLLYTLPVSLFGMSVSAAELPGMASAASLDPAGSEAVRRRLDAGLRRIAFFVVPSAVAFVALGDVIAGAIFQFGQFTAADARYVWGILAGSAVGLLASTLGRLYSSTYYALRDTRTPLRYALVRVTLTTALGYLFAFPLPRSLGVAPAWGAAGLTASAGIAGWVELLLLRRTLNARIGRTGLSAGYAIRLWIAASAGAGAAWAIKLYGPMLAPRFTAAVVLAPYAAVFFGTCVALDVPEASDAMRRIGRRQS